TARVRNRLGAHESTIGTNGNQNSVDIASRDSGYGSSVNGGELLFLALATCYCNDIYREAAKRGIAVQQVEVSVDGEFGAEGEPARSVSYSARVIANATEAEIEDLMRHTDTVSEIQNTLRASTPVILRSTEAHSISIER
ncbi:MAG: OsmC family protein, partial [Thermomicrobiales bacterium]